LGQKAQEFGNFVLVQPVFVPDAGLGQHLGYPSGLSPSGRSLIQQRHRNDGLKLAVGEGFFDSRRCAPRIDEG